MGKLRSGNIKARNLAIFAGCVLFWITIDRITKIFIDSNFAVGDIVVDNIFDLFRFDVVHNTGAAWGSFSGATPIFAIIAIFVCVLVCYFVWKEASVVNLAEIIGLALLVAGGIGNAMDRVLHGYVVDFITPTFISFPTFNIADIGITCGIILAAFGYMAQAKEARIPSKNSQGKD